MEKGEARWQDGWGIRLRHSTYGSCAKSRGYPFLHCLPLFILEGIALVVLFEKVWGMNVLGWFPGVVAFGVPFPFHKVLERSRPPMTSVVDEMFHFVFFCSLD